MPKALRTFLTFLAGALAGCLLVVVVGILLGVITIALYEHTHPRSGLGAVAGGFSGAAVLLVPILSGTVAVLFSRRSRPSP